MMRQKIILIPVSISLLLAGFLLFLSNQSRSVETGGRSHWAPTITVLSEFPDGTVNLPEIDITYEAIPGTAAAIDHVYYEIFDSEGRLLKPEYYIYVSPAQGFPAQGTLGKGTIFLYPEAENYVVITAVDSNGHLAQCAIENHPYFDGGHDPEINYDRFVPSLKDGRSYLPDMLVLYAEKDISYEEVVEMSASTGGNIVGSAPMMGLYYIQVPESSEDELAAMCETLTATYQDKLVHITLYYEGGTD